MNVDIVDNKSVGVSAPGFLTPGTRVQMTEMMYRDDGDTDPRPNMQPMFDIVGLKCGLCILITTFFYFI